VSFAAEPFGTFVEDLLANLTGGTSRVRFGFVPAERPFRLAEHERMQAGTVRVHGLVDGTFADFVRGVDFRVEVDGTLTWAGDATDFKPAGARLPDEGTDVWVGFDRVAGDTPSLLNDRNPGSVLRTLAESFAREFAVLSQQLGLVYDAAFVDTASGRDLDQVAALVGVVRRGATHARGEVALRRTTPAPADITVSAGTLISTAEAPRVTVETTETVTLRRGAFSVGAPVRAQVAGPAGVAPRETLSVLHRPIFGVEQVLNPDQLTVGGGSETDDELRARVRRALETSGRSTVGALRGALASIEGIREQDVLVQEDHLNSPGLVHLTVSAKIDQATALLASQVLEEYRPAGVRIAHNLPDPALPVPTLAEETGGGGDGDPAPAGVEPPDQVFDPVITDVVVTPASLQLTEDQRARLTADVQAAVHAVIDDVGAGEVLVYNKIVAAVMAVDGVLDVVVEIGFQSTAAPVDLTRYNLRPNAGRRPSLADQDMTVTLRGDRVVLDVSAEVERGPLTAGQETSDALEMIRRDISARLKQAFALSPGHLDEAGLRGMLPADDRYTVETVAWTFELTDEGLVVQDSNVPLTLDPGQVVTVRSVRVSEPQAMTT
jgi:uncharacterized phage protein gp47/JayE